MDLLTFPPPPSPPPGVIPKHWYESEAADRLAQHVYREDVRLGRCPHVPWGELQPLTKALYRDRAAIAIRLGDPTVVDTARERAALVVARHHAHEFATRGAARRVLQTALRVLLQHLRGSGVSSC